jgi:glutamyl-Q tRNA(Asp) synthetase
MTAAEKTVTRFAPSPTGLLHLGHAHAALFAEARARESGGRFLLRIEDIDQGRCRPEFEAAILEDLNWLGLRWQTPVRRQSEHFEDYRGALAALQSMNLLYPCFCTRKEILAEIEAAGAAPHSLTGRAMSPEGGPLYPGTCRGLTDGERQRRLLLGAGYALRLDMAAAAEKAGRLAWTDSEAGTVAATPEIFGDVVLARKDTPASYHLAVTWDDHAQGVTLVTRGKDLFQATHVHRLLQALLDLSTPAYHHHRLLTNAAGERLAKRDQGLTIRALREAGTSPAGVRRMAGF